MGAHCQRRQDYVGRRFRPDRHHNDLIGLPGFGQPHGSLHRVPVERVHRHAQICSLDARPVRLHPDANGVVDDALDGHEDLHAGAMAKLEVGGKAPSSAC
jgi:hypothetical protein